MKKIFYALTVFAFFGLTGVADAASKEIGLYLGGHLGGSVQSIHNRDAKSYDDDFSWTADQKNHGVFSGGITVGYDLDTEFKVPVRVELDYTARSRSKSESSVTAYDANDKYDVSRTDKISLQTLMVNAWFDIPTGTDFTPYLGGGIGFGFVDYKVSGYVHDYSHPSDSYGVSGSKSKTNFAWSLGTGVGYALTENIDLDLGYRYINAGSVSASAYNTEVDEGAKTKARAEVHDFLFGVRYTF